jgi:hypothetical protein
MVPSVAAMRVCTTEAESVTAGVGAAQADSTNITSDNAASNNCFIDFADGARSGHPSPKPGL